MLSRKRLIIIYLSCTAMKMWSLQNLKITTVRSRLNST